MNDIKINNNRRNHFIGLKTGLLKSHFDRHATVRISLNCNVYGISFFIKFQLNYTYKFLDTRNNLS